MAEGGSLTGDRERDGGSPGTVNWVAKRREGSTISMTMEEADDGGPDEAGPAG